MNIVIYEDSFTHRMFMVNVIREYIQQNHIKNILLDLYTDNKVEIERYVERNRMLTLYFIDIVDNQGDHTGLELAKLIKDKNNSAIVVIVTQFLEKIIHSTEHKVIAMNIITKSKSAKQEIFDTIKLAYSQIPNGDCLIINCRNCDVFKALYDDIYMIESVKHGGRIIIHYRNGKFDCADSLKGIMPKLDQRFRRCQKSYIVKLEKIERVSKKTREITLRNDLLCYYSAIYGLGKEFEDGTAAKYV